MSIFLILAFLFCIGSMVGWGIEVLFRRFFSASNPQRKWVNPGFLTGPYLPLYGFGLCILYLLAGCEADIAIQNQALRKLALFAVMAVCETGLEYLAGLIFIRGMKVKLWDYSKMWGNIQGIVCPLFTLFWAVLSAVYYFLVHPYILDALHWLSNNLAFSFLVGFFYGVFSIDFAYSAQLLVKIRRFAQENGITVRFEELKARIRESEERRRNKARFFLGMYSPTPIREHLKEYLGRKREGLENILPHVPRAKRK